MSLAKTPYASDVHQLLAGMSKDDLMATAKTAANNRILPQNKKDAITVILIHTPDLSRLFSYRHLKSQDLFEYLISQEIAVDSQASKLKFISLIQELWEKRANKRKPPDAASKRKPPDAASKRKPPDAAPTNKTSRKESTKHLPSQSHTELRNVPQVVCKPARYSSDVITLPRTVIKPQSTTNIFVNVNNITVNNERGVERNNNFSASMSVGLGNQTINASLFSASSSSAPASSPVATTISSEEFSRHFCEWYYTMVNRLQPACQHIPGDTLRDEVFCTNSSVELYLIGPTTSQRSASGQASTCTLLRDTFKEFGILFNPNVDNGVQAFASDHGLVKLCVCGTLHQVDSLTGVFEQEFGLVNSPIEKSWKIVYTKLNLRQADPSTPIPVLPKSQIFMITM